MNGAEMHHERQASIERMKHSKPSEPQPAAWFQESTSLIRPNPRGDRPIVSETAFVDPTAILCGQVIVESGVFIGPYAVIRADETDGDGNMHPIRIGSGSNIQDGVVIHSKAGAAVTIGSRTSVAHRSIVHGPCTVGDDVFVGFNSVLFNCTVGDRSVIRHNSVIEGCDLPAGFHVPSTTTVHSNSDLAVIPQVTPDAAAFSESVAATNVDLAQAYRRISNQL